jgi:electron transfer flavoprotein alpha subunit
LPENVVVCTWGDRLDEEAEELLTLARQTGDLVTWLSVGAIPERAEETAARQGVATLMEVTGTSPAAQDTLVEALTQYAREKSPRLLLFGQTFESRLVAPCLAGRLGVPVVTNAVALAVYGDSTIVTASAYGGDTRATYEVRGPFPHMVCLLPDSVRPEPAPEPSVPTRKAFVPDLAGVKERVRMIAPARNEGARLEDAQVIVAGGRGLGKAENFHLIEELAEALGGMPAASRPLVDDGWTDPSRQVGLTGRVTRPALYVAVGISGASQHMAGCSAAKTIVAVNRDQDAAIFRYAKYGIVGDCLEIIPELIKAARER